MNPYSTQLFFHFIPLMDRISRTDHFHLLIAPGWFLHFFCDIQYCVLFLDIVCSGFEALFCVLSVFPLFDIITGYMIDPHKHTLFNIVVSIWSFYCCSVVVVVFKKFALPGVHGNHTAGHRFDPGGICVAQFFTGLHFF